MKNVRKSNAYTLIELIVVFVIIVVLFLASLPVYFSARNNISFNQTIENAIALINSAVELSNNPDETLKNADGVCVTFDKLLNQITIAARPTGEASCVKAVSINKLSLDSDYSIDCEECSVTLPKGDELNTENIISARIKRGALQKTFTVSAIGVVDVK